MIFQGCPKSRIFFQNILGVKLTWEMNNKHEKNVFCRNEVFLVGVFEENPDSYSG